jgi:hypothetical protein
VSSKVLVIWKHIASWWRKKETMANKVR